MANRYPSHIFFPKYAQPPDWTKEIESAFDAVRRIIDTEAGSRKTSNKVLEILRPELEKIGFDVERGKKKTEKLERPVFFGEMGEVGLSFDIDAYHKNHGIAMEVEAVRTIRANALYKALIEMSLMVDVKNAAIAIPLRYSYKSGTETPYKKSKEILDSIYTSGRIKFPFEGAMLIGY